VKNEVLLGELPSKSGKCYQVTRQIEWVALELRMIPCR
jgi:hypothetical protein